MRFSVPLLLLGLSIWPTPAAAQEAPATETLEAQAPAPDPSPDAELAAATEQVTPATQPAPSPTADADTESAQPSTWTGPRVELSYRVYSLSDSTGGGAVNSVAFAGFLPTRTVRAGGGLEAGGRAYKYGPTEGLLSGHAFVGYQHLRDLGRVVPYVVALGELGVVIGKRFHTPVTRLLRGAGIEIGADVNLVRSLYLGLGLSYLVYTMDDLAYETFGLRLSIGL